MSGFVAEKRVIDWLVLHGWSIEEVRWRPIPSVEIDIVATKMNTCIFVETKYHLRGSDVQRMHRRQSTLMTIMNIWQSRNYASQRPGLSMRTSLVCACIHDTSQAYILCKRHGYGLLCLENNSSISY